MSGAASPRVRWECKPFGSLTVFELHAALRLRAEVFVVEQACAYQDPDALDPDARHVLGWIDGRLAAYARFLESPDGVRLGRIATAQALRGSGLGRALIRESLDRIGARRVVIHAQAHLRGLYGEFGFRAEGSEFPEDGIPHIRMVRDAHPKG